MKWLQGLLKDIPGGPEPSEISSEALPLGTRASTEPGRRSPDPADTYALSPGADVPIAAAIDAATLPVETGDTSGHHTITHSPLSEPAPSTAGETAVNTPLSDHKSTAADRPADDEDLGELISAAINGAVERFERLAAGQAELGELVRSHWQAAPPSSDGAPEMTSPTTSAPLVNEEQSTSPVLARLDELATRQQELNQQFQQRIRSDEVQAKALERLHDELRQYKANFIRQEMLPLLKEVIFCHDFVANELNRLSANDTATTPEPGSAPPADAGTRALQVLLQMLLDLLFKFDIEPFTADEPQFDPKTQQCTRVIPTDLPEQDKQIAEIGLPGFRSPDSIVRRQHVSVYKHKPASAPPAIPGSG